MKKLLTLFTALLFLGSLMTVSAQDPIAPIGGTFYINARGDKAVFARGNLQYQQSTNTWRCAPNQYDWQGEAANEQMGNAAYEGWVDLFCWSLGAENNFGATSAYLSTAYHNKNFVDWGTLFSDEYEWSTLSSAEWNYLLNSRPNANDKWGMAMIEDNLGMILLPDEWTAPSGVAFVPRTNPTSELWDDDDMIDATYDHFRVKPENMPANKFTLSEWAELEAAGAVFLPYAGRRSGGYGNHTNRDDQEVAGEYNFTYYENYLGTYWTSTMSNPSLGQAHYVYTLKYDGEYKWGKAVIWGENGRYGQSVRLVKRILKDPDYTRNVTEGRYGTICMPKKSEIEGATIFEVAYRDNSLNKIFFDEVENGILVGGRPYIFLPNDGENQVKIFYHFAEPTQSAGNYHGLYGFIGADEDDEFTIPANSGNYLIQNNQYREVQDGVAKIKSYRAYLKMSEVPTNAVAPMPGRRRVAIGAAAPQLVTDIENLNVGDQPMKVLIDGQLYILRGEKMYNINGQIVK